MSVLPPTSTHGVCASRVDFSRWHACGCDSKCHRDADTVSDVDVTDILLLFAASPSLSDLSFKGENVITVPCSLFCLRRDGGGVFCLLWVCHFSIALLPISLLYYFCCLPQALPWLLKVYGLHLHVELCKSLSKGDPGFALHIVHFTHAVSLTL